MKKLGLVVNLVIWLILAPVYSWGLIKINNLKPGDSDAEGIASSRPRRAGPDHAQESSRIRTWKRGWPH